MNRDFYGPKVLTCKVIFNFNFGQQRITFLGCWLHIQTATPKAPEDGRRSSISSFESAIAFSSGVLRGGK
jgi:hypothetical protein